MRDQENKEERSDLWRHCKEKHNGIMMKFKMSVTETFMNDALLKQVSEAVKIKNVPIEKSLNTKDEHNL